MDQAMRLICTDYQGYRLIPRDVLALLGQSHVWYRVRNTNNINEFARIRIRDMIRPNGQIEKIANHLNCLTCSTDHSFAPSDDVLARLFGWAFMIVCDLHTNQLTCSQLTCSRLADPSRSIDSQLTNSQSADPSRSIDSQLTDRQLTDRQLTDPSRSIDSQLTDPIRMANQAKAYRDGVREISQNIYTHVYGQIYGTATSIPFWKTYQSHEKVLRPIIRYNAEVSRLKTQYRPVRVAKSVELLEQVRGFAKALDNIRSNYLAHAGDVTDATESIQIINPVALSVLCEKTQRLEHQIMLCDIAHLVDRIVIALPIELVSIILGMLGISNTPVPYITATQMKHFAVTLDTLRLQTIPNPSIAQYDPQILKLFGDKLVPSNTHIAIDKINSKYHVNPPVCASHYQVIKLPACCRVCGKNTIGVSCVCVVCRVARYDPWYVEQNVRRTRMLTNLTRDSRHIVADIARNILERPHVSSNAMYRQFTKEFARQYTHARTIAYTETELPFAPTQPCVECEEMISGNTVMVRCDKCVESHLALILSSGQAEHMAGHVKWLVVGLANEHNMLESMRRKCAPIGCYCGSMHGHAGFGGDSLVFKVIRMCDNNQTHIFSLDTTRVPNGTTVSDVREIMRLIACI
jgi:hypothetical protein